jgi:hypothetical protein
MFFLFLSRRTRAVHFLSISSYIIVLISLDGRIFLTFYKLCIIDLSSWSIIALNKMNYIHEGSSERTDHLKNLLRLYWRSLASRIEGLSRQQGSWWSYERERDYLAPNNVNLDALMCHPPVSPPRPSTIVLNFSATTKPTGPRSEKEYRVTYVVPEELPMPQSSIYISLYIKKRRNK